MSSFNIYAALNDIQDGGVQGCLALADAVRADCDECESLDLPGGEILGRTGRLGMIAMYGEREEGVKLIK